MDPGVGRATAVDVESLDADRQIGLAAGFAVDQRRIEVQAGIEEGGMDAIRVRRNLSRQHNSGKHFAMAATQFPHTFEARAVLESAVAYLLVVVLSALRERAPRPHVLDRGRPRGGFITVHEAAEMDAPAIGVVGVTAREAECDAVGSVGRQREPHVPLDAFLQHQRLVVCHLIERDVDVPETHSRRSGSRLERGRGRQNREAVNTVIAKVRELCERAAGVEMDVTAVRGKRRAEKRMRRSRRGGCTRGAWTDGRSIACARGFQPVALALERVRGKRGPSARQVLVHRLPARGDALQVQGLERPEHRSPVLPRFGE
jgi:hypothetical protein